MANYGFSVSHGTVLHAVKALRPDRRRHYEGITTNADSFTKSCLERSQTWAQWKCGGQTPFAITADKIEDFTEPIELTNPCRNCFPNGLKDVLSGAA